jgi:phosphoribosylcarboxyaminoimidazole (NCAIR) mutase
VGIDNARNAAMLAAQILALTDDAVAQAIHTYRQKWN